MILIVYSKCIVRHKFSVISARRSFDKSVDSTLAKLSYSILPKLMPGTKQELQTYPRMLKWITEWYVEQWCYQNNE